MWQIDWIKLILLTDWKKFLSFFLRYLYPGILVILFIFWRYSKFIYKIGTNNIALTIVTLSIFSFASGVIIYFIHRALFHPLIIWIEKNTCGIPQYEFHKSIVDKLKAPPWAMKIKIVQGCINEVIRRNASAEDRAEFWFFNSAVHSLLTTSLVCFFILLHDILLLDFPSHSIWLWFVLFVFFLLIGIATDYFWADERETSFINQYKEEYKKILSQRIKIIR